jgi:hypothetical protein
VGPEDIRENKYGDTFTTDITSGYSNEVLTNNAGFKYRRIILSFSENEASNNKYRLFIPAPYSMCKKIGNSYVLTEDYPTTDNLPGHNNDYV